MRVLEGKSVFSGIAIGKISILQKADTSVKRTKVENPEAEITRVQEAKEKASANRPLMTAHKRPQYFLLCLVFYTGRVSNQFRWLF